MPRRIDPVTLLITLIVTFPLLGTFFPVESYLSAPTLSNPLGTPVAPTIATTLVLMGMYGVVFALSLRKAPEMMAGLARNWFLLAFALWAIVTALWAESPSLSFNRSGRLLIAVLYALYIGQACDKRTVIRILFIAACIGMISSILVTILVPSLSRVVDVRGAVRGAYAHKNVLGGVSALALVISVYGRSINVAPRFMCNLTAFLALVMLVLSNSVTSLFAMVLAGSVAFYLKIFGGRSSQERFLALAIGVTAAGGFYLVLAEYPEILDFTGRDLSTLTGRTDVWRFAHSMIDLKPFWGWGHGAWDNASFEKYALEELGWTAPNAHNSWLDFRLQLGIPGLAIGIICAAVGLKRAFFAVLTSRDDEYLVWVAIILSEAVRSATETLCVDPSAVEFFWFSLAVVRLGVLVSHVPSRAPLARPKTMHRMATQPAFSKRRPSEI